MRLFSSGQEKLSIVRIKGCPFKWVNLREHVWAFGRDQENCSK